MSLYVGDRLVHPKLHTRRSPDGGRRNRLKM